MKDADKDDLDRFDNQALQTAFGGSSGDRGKIIHFSKEVASDQSKV